MGFRQTFNPAMISLLRSPLHSLVSKTVLLITFTGRKSGKTFTTPVDYFWDGKDIIVFSAPERQWWRNLRGGAPVMVRVQGKDLRGTAEVFEDTPHIAQALLKALQSSPSYQSFYRVELDSKGQPKDPDALTKVAQTRVLIRIKLEKR